MCAKPRVFTRREGCATAPTEQKSHRSLYHKLCRLEIGDGEKQKTVMTLSSVVTMYTRLKRKGTLID